MHVAVPQIGELPQRILEWLLRHRSSLAQGVATTTTRLVEALTALVLVVFSLFFFIYDGDRLWSWFVSLFSAARGPRVDAAGRGAWRTLQGWAHGTFLIAVFHGVVISIALLVLGVPLVAPLGLLVFLGAFIPIVGAFAAGGAAVAVALITKGGITALIVLIVIVLENQAESHLLQPFVVGHYVKLHPLALVVVLAIGAIFGGIPGAVVAVPFTASARRAWHAWNQARASP